MIGVSVTNYKKFPYNDRGELLLRLLNGRKRFSELRDLYPSPCTLTERLRELESLGLLDRELDKERRSSIYYFLLSKGKQVAEIYREYRTKIQRIMGQ